MKKSSKELEAMLHVAEGSLSDEQIAMGLHSCYCNARDLFEDAQLLLKSRRIARAFGLCILCLEELAKIPLLINAVSLKRKEQKVWKKFWKALRSHTLKQNVWSIYGKSPLLPESRRQRYYRDSYPRNLPSLEKLKQLSFYVDFLNGGTAMIPAIFFEHMRGLVGFVFKMTEDRLKAFHPLHSKPERSREAVALASRIKFVGLSEEQQIDLLFSSIVAVKNYGEQSAI